MCGRIKRLVVLRNSITSWSVQLVVQFDLEKVAEFDLEKVAEFLSFFY